MGSKTEQELAQKVIRYLKTHNDLDTVSMEVKGSKVGNEECILHVVCEVRAQWERWVVFENGEITQPPSAIEILE